MNWPAVALSRYRLARNALFTRGRKTSSARLARHPLLGASLAIALGTLICLALSTLFAQLAAENTPASETAGALALILTAASFGLLVFDLHETVSTLVVDSDLDLLRRAPVPAWGIFILKLFDVFPRTSLLLVALAIPAVVAFHLFYPLPLWGFLVLPLQLATLWAIPLGLGAAIALMLLRHAPTGRAREVLGLFSTLTLFVLWLANSFLLPRIAGSTGDPLENVRHTLSGISGTYWISPGAWAAGALAAEAEGSTAAALRLTALLAGVAALALGLTAWVATQNLERVQSRVATEGATKGRKRAHFPGASSTAADAASAKTSDLARTPGVAPATNVMPESSVASRPGVAVTRAPAATAAPRRRLLRAVLTRDGRLLLREWTLMGDVVTAAILWTLLPLVGAPLLSVPSALLARAMLLTLTVGLGYEIAARAVPFERGAWAWMKLAPVSVRQWMLAKFTGAALLSLPLVLIATASMIASFHLAPRAVLEALCVVFPALVLSLSVGLWTGTVFANPNWTNPRSMLTAPGRIVATLLLLVQAGAWLLLVGLEHLGLWLPPHFALWGPATLAGLTAALPIRAAARHLRAREWQG